MNILTILVVAGNLLVTVGLWVFASVRLRTLETLVRSSIHSSHHLFSEGALREEEFSLWSFRDDQWQMIRPCSAPGLEIGPPPSRTGRFANEIVRTRGVRTRSTVSV